MTQRQPGRRQGRKAAGDDYVCGKVNVYTLAAHVEPMCSLRNASSSASHSGEGRKKNGREEEEEGREGGKKKKSTHWKVAN